MKRSQTSSAAAIAGGLALAALIGCGREPTMAEKSAAAFQEAQAKEEAFGSGGHAHGHGAPGAASPEEAIHAHGHLPELTPEEIAEMEALNPKTPAEWEEMQAEEAFLAGEQEPEAGPTSDHHATTDHRH
jgi:hypothetical protein